MIIVTQIISTNVQVRTDASKCRVLSQFFQKMIHRGHRVRNIFDEFDARIEIRHLKEEAKHKKTQIRNPDSQMTV